MKTILVIEITHPKPINEPHWVNICGQRIYNYLFARGFAVGVKVLETKQDDTP
jgi:hypothetical protein